MIRAEWIWYPDDFEIVLSNRFMANRYERDLFIPPFWKQSTCYINVKFSKIIELSQPDCVKIKAEGRFNVQIDGQYIFGVTDELTLPVGKHEIIVSVYNDCGLPCLYICGREIATDGSWQVTCNDHRFVPAACDGEFLRGGTPNTFRLPVCEEKPVDVLTLGGRAIYDFGKEVFARISLWECEGNPVAYYGESLPEVQDIACCELLSTDFEKKDGCYETTIAKAFRYVTIDGASFARMTAGCEYLPMRAGRFECDNARLNQIWQVAMYTLGLNSREFLIDGIKRDRWIWSADTYQSCLMHYYSFFDKGVMKRTMTALFGKAPFDVYLNHIMDYSFIWIMCFYDYWQYSGDEKYVADNCGKAIEIMEYCLSRRDENGLMDTRPGDWVFVDWAELDNAGCVCFEQMLLVTALRCCVALCGRFGYPERADRYAAIYDETYLKLETFWDDDKKAYVYSMKNGAMDGKVLKYPNMFAVLYDLCDEKRQELIKQNVLLNPDIPKITTPYMRFFELAALCKLGETNVVLDEIVRYWGGMLDQGATTFWEVYDSEKIGDEQYGMYGRRYGKSLCHAWGASPLYLIGRYVLGLIPKKEGREFCLKPNLCGLNKLSAELPLSEGSIRIDVEDGYIGVLSDRLSGQLILDECTYEVIRGEYLRVPLEKAKEESA